MYGMSLKNIGRLCCEMDDIKHKIDPKQFASLKEEIDSSSSNTYSRTQSFLNVCRKLIVALVMFVLIYWTQRLFAIKFNSVDIIHFKVEFSASQLNAALTNIVPISIWIGIITLVLEALLSFIRCCQQSGMFLKLWSTTQWFVMVCAAVWIFSISLVPYSSLDRNTQDNLWPVVKRWYAKSEYYEIVNSYGLFRRMTGVGGRPEVVIEGSNSIDGPWKEYNFLYKPGPLEQSLPVVAPHQPRLDWQMWFAALGSYNHNPWFVHLAYKLLTGERDVLDLMDSNQPFKNPPRYVRAILYKYHYTRIKEDLGSISDVIRNARSIKSWWRREFSSEYLPPVSKEEPTLKQFLSHYELGESSGRAQISTGRLHNALNFLRSKVRRVDPFKLIAWLFTIGVVFNILVNQQSTIPERIKTHQD